MEYKVPESATCVKQAVSGPLMFKTGKVTQSLYDAAMRSVGHPAAPGHRWVPKSRNYSEPPDPATLEQVEQLMLYEEYRRGKDTTNMPMFSYLVQAAQMFSEGKSIKDVARETGISTTLTANIRSGRNYWFII